MESVAYDFSRFDRRLREEERAAAADTPKVAAVQPKVKAHVPVRLILVSIICMSILMLIVVYSMQLSELAATNALVEKQIAKLDSQYNVLRASYESRLNLKEIEEYAINVLGMRKPEADQIVYLNLGGESHGEIITGAEKASMFGAVAASVQEYFG